jgi:glycine cleavage system regulatory protein
MSLTLLLTVAGVDRTGLVESLAERIALAGGNWEESRMARLGGQFAGIVLVTVPAGRADELVAGLRALDAVGLQVSARPADPAVAAPPGARVQLVIRGADRPGIVRDVSRVLAGRGVNVEELASEVESAAMSGEPLFVARARLRVPPGGALADLRAALEAVGREVMVDLTAE